VLAGVQAALRRDADLLAALGVDLQSTGLTHAQLALRFRMSDVDTLPLDAGRLLAAMPAGR
jgi:hypothetical protein